MRGGDLGNQGMRPGSTFQEQRRKARAGAFRGQQYGATSISYGVKTGSVRAPEVGQGTAIVKKQKLSTRMTGNDPTEKQFPQRPGGTGPRE